MIVFWLLYALIGFGFAVGITKGERHLYGSNMLLMGLAFILYWVFWPAVMPYELLAE